MLQLLTASGPSGNPGVLAVRHVVEELEPEAGQNKRKPSMVEKNVQALPLKRVQRSATPTSVVSVILYICIIRVGHIPKK